MSVDRGVLAGASPFQVVIISDDEVMAGPLASTLGRERYVASWISDSDEARAAVLAFPPDLVVLDLDGYALDALVEFRRGHGAAYHGPVLALASDPDELHRVDILDSGADDLLTKPFALAELQARTRALLRRARSPAVAGGREVVVDRAARRVFVNQAPVEVTAREFEVLAMLTSAGGGTVVLRERLMDEIWSADVVPKVLDVTIARIRTKLRAAGARVQIAAVRGIGFRLQPLPDEDPPPG